MSPDFPPVLRPATVCTPAATTFRYHFWTQEKEKNAFFAENLLLMGFEMDRLEASTFQGASLATSCYNEPMAPYSPRLTSLQRLLFSSVRPPFNPREKFSAAIFATLCALLLSGCFNSASPQSPPSLPTPQTLFVDAGSETLPRFPADLTFANQVDSKRTLGNIHDAPDGGASAVVACPVVQMPPLSQARLLTTAQYQRSIEVLFDLDQNFTSDFPAENQVEGFPGNHRVHQASSQLVDKWMVRAEEIAQILLSERRALLLRECFLDTNQQPLVENQCAEKFIAHWQLRIFRRPPSISEQQTFTELFELARTRLSFDESIELLLSTLLQSPAFLYRGEWVSVDDSPDLPIELDDFAFASRLAFFLTGGPPDEELQQTAAESLLQDEEILHQQAARLLRDDGKYAVVSFTRSWLGLDALASLQKDEVTFPTWTPDLRQAYAAEIETFVADVFFDEATPTFAHLFSRRQSRIQEPLAAIYNAPGLDFNDGESTIEHVAGQRAGVLTLAGIQALLAKNNQNSPIARGVFMRERILCEPLSPPPDDVPIIPPDIDPNATTRERFAAHTEAPSCAGCHWLIDPIGFGFEHYDALGRYRDFDNGFPVDASGEVLYAYEREENLEGPFVGAIELFEKIKNSSQAKRCFSKHWFRFAFGRGAQPQDSCLTDALDEQFVEGEGNLQELMLTIATHRSFRIRSPLADENVASDLIVDVEDAGSPNQNADAGQNGLNATDAGTPHDGGQGSTSTFFDGGNP